MSIKWRNKAFKASIVSLAFLLTINPLDFNSVIRANEDIKEKTENSDQSIDFNNNQNGTEIIDGTIDMKQMFKFQGIARKNSNLTFIDSSEIHKTASFIHQDDSKYRTPNTAKLLTNASIAGLTEHHKQTVLANSTEPINLKRDFEIEASFSIDKADFHGFVFAIHGTRDYQPQGTDNSLGVYSNGKNSFTNAKGLDRGFVMEVDTYADDDNHGDNYIGKQRHIGYYETGIDGQLKSRGNNFTLGKNLQTTKLSASKEGLLFTKKNIAGQNDHVKFTFRWNARTKHGSVSFSDRNLQEYNLSERQIDVLARLQNIGDGSAYISIGGTTDWAGKSFMEVGVHKIKYNDITPFVKTYIKTEKGDDVEAVYPGQHIKVKHYIHNNYKTNYDIDDDIKLHMLYLQFLNNDQIGGYIPARDNFESEHVKRTIRDSNDNIIYSYDNEVKFDGDNPVPIVFPRNNMYFVLEYDIVVKNSVDKIENYNKEFFLYFQVKIGQRGIKGIQIKEKNIVRLLPKIVSENEMGNPQRFDKHDVFQYYGRYEDNNAITADILHYLWDKLYVTSSSDSKVPINHQFNQTPNGTPIEKKYYVNKNGSIEAYTDFRSIPSRLPKTSSVTLVVSVADKKLNNLKSYYYRTIVMADTFKLSDDGDYVIFGNNLNPIKETQLNLKDKGQFISYAKESSGLKSIKRDSKDAAFESSTFSVPSTTINVDKSWLYNNKVDLKVESNFNPKTYLIESYVNNSSSTRINLNLSVVENTLQRDDGKNNELNGNTSYIIIPRTINITDDNTTPNGILGIADVYFSGYTTGKKYNVWVDKNIELRNNQSIVNLSSTNLNNVQGNNQYNNREYLGVVNEMRIKNNPLQVKLTGQRYNGPITTFRGNLKFYIEMLQ